MKLDETRIMRDMPYIVYILECHDGSLYTGITTDLARRFAEHKNKKGGSYTASHPVRSILYQEECINRSTALKREVAIKKMPRRQKLEIIKTHETSSTIPLRAGVRRHKR